MSLSSSFRDDTLAFVVPDYSRKEFLARAAIHAKTGLRFGILREEYYAAKAHDVLPQAEWVELSSPREFFAQPRSGQLDALLLTAEAGSAWTLMYPEFAAVVPQPGLMSLPLAHAVVRDDRELIDFVNAWLQIKQKDGTAAQRYD